jgi:hypothetical protein
VAEEGQERSIDLAPVLEKADRSWMTLLLLRSHRPTEGWIPPKVSPLLDTLPQRAAGSKTGVAEVWGGESALSWEQL